MPRIAFHRVALLGVACAGLSSVACSFIARGPDQYRADTTALLDTRTSAIKACYDKELASDPALTGNVVVNFKVQKKTGNVVDLALDPSSTAPEKVSTCVLASLADLKLLPEDRRDGIAQFSWAFSVNAPAGQPAGG